MSEFIVFVWISMESSQGAVTLSVGFIWTEAGKTYFQTQNFCISQTFTRTTKRVQNQFLCSCINADCTTRWPTGNTTRESSCSFDAARELKGNLWILWEALSRTLDLQGTETELKEIRTFNTKKTRLFQHVCAPTCSVLPFKPRHPGRFQTDSWFALV